MYLFKLTHGSKFDKLTRDELIKEHEKELEEERKKIEEERKKIEEMHRIEEEKLRKEREKYEKSISKKGKRNTFDADCLDEMPAYYCKEAEFSDMCCSAKRSINF